MTGRISNISLLILIAPIFVFGQFGYGNSKEGAGTLQIKKRPRTSDEKIRLNPNKNKNPGPSKARVNPRAFDGNYQMVGTKLSQSGDIYCLSRYTIKLRVLNGKASHQLAFSSKLLVNMRGNVMHIHSKKEEGGGFWSGRIRLTTNIGTKTAGYLRWGGDGRKCEFNMTAQKL